MEAKRLCPFYYTVCHVCKVFPNTVNVTMTLKRCQRCKLVAYCSVDHQRMDWLEHRDFCKAVQNVARVLQCSCIFDTAVGNRSKESWRTHRFNLRIMCELALERRLTKSEGEMLFFPRVCLVCHDYDQKKLRDCDVCHCVSYCSDEHMKEDAEFHQKSCYELKASFDLDIGEFLGTLPDIEIKHKNRILCSSTSQFCSEFLNQTSHSEELQLDPLASRIYLTFLSCPLTFINAVFKSGLHLSERLVVHVVGAGLFETQYLDAWDVVFHWLTKLQVLHLILIGPSVVKASQVYLCSDCKEAGCKLIIEFCLGQLYNEYTESSIYLKPDMIVMFNCGLSEFSGGVQDTWKNSIPNIMNSRCPVLITSYTASESEKDLERLNEVDSSMSIIVKSEENIFSCRNPVRDWEQYHAHTDRQVFYNNAYVSLLVPQS